MKYPLATIGLLATVFSLGQPMRLETREFSELEPTPQAVRRIKWPRRTIAVSLSTSLLNPGAHIKPGSDVVGAARRALSRWSTIANLRFVSSWSTLPSVSPAHDGDGISLITIADTAENEAFNVDSTAGRTRVFFDPETGLIQEADISINPKPRSAEGADVQFSTDGTPGTYDLEATFTHEIGHLLGLDHSGVLSSTMQSHQAFNGTYGLPALTERTLSEEDRQRIKALYNPKQHAGKIEGRLLGSSNSATLVPLGAVHVWAENVTTGRVIASDKSADDGTYVLSELVPGKYRVLVSGAGTNSPSETPNGSRKFSSVEIANQVTVNPDGATTVNYNLVPAQTAQSKLNPRMIGLNGDLSVVALPLEPGSKVKIYLSGEGIDNVPGTSISVNSPYFSVDAGSLTREQMHTALPVVSFELNVAPNAPFGDYSLRLQSNSGEIAYVPGALTIDPGVITSASNPVDDSRFFIAQHYKDITGRQPSSELLDRLVGQLNQCGGRSDCLRGRKLDISNALFVDDELPATGMFIHGLYSAGLGRRPKFAEFNVDRTVLLDRGADLESSRLALALIFVERPEFQRKYSQVKAKEFVDSLMSSAMETNGVNIDSERDALLALFDGTNQGHARILTRLITRPAFVDAQYNQTFVLLQYFSYLRRDPDKDGYDAWVNLLKSKPLRDRAAGRSVVCAFLNSAEYQSRFAMVDTHNTGTCN